MRVALCSLLARHDQLYPYHLADVMVLGLRTTGFTYYYNILSDMLRADKSYDSLPNFPAADCTCPADDLGCS